MEVGWREGALAAQGATSKHVGLETCGFLAYDPVRAAGPGISHEYLRMKGSWWLLGFSFKKDLLFPSILFSTGCREGEKCYSASALQYLTK